MLHANFINSWQIQADTHRVQNYQNAGYLYNITFMFSMCHRTTETPDKYDRDLKSIYYILLRNQNFLWLRK